jgi:hypothetical protein
MKTIRRYSFLMLFFVVCVPSLQAGWRNWPVFRQACGLYRRCCSSSVQSVSSSSTCTSSSVTHTRSAWRSLINDYWMRWRASMYSCFIRYTYRPSTIEVDEDVRACLRNNEARESDDDEGAMPCLVYYPTGNVDRMTLSHACQGYSNLHPLAILESDLTILRADRGAQGDEQARISLNSPDWAAGGPDNVTANGAQSAFAQQTLVSEKELLELALRKGLHFRLYLANHSTVRASAKGTNRKVWLFDRKHKKWLYNKEERFQDVPRDCSSFIMRAIVKNKSMRDIVIPRGCTFFDHYMLSQKTSDILQGLLLHYEKNTRYYIAGQQSYPATEQEGSLNAHSEMYMICGGSEQSQAIATIIGPAYIAEWETM